MNSNKIKNNLTIEIKEKLKKSKFNVLTKEYDFLIKNLKKAGLSLEITNIYFSQKS